jgi:Myb-like DNA-binding domain
MMNNNAAEKVKLAEPRSGFNSIPSKKKKKPKKNSIGGPYKYPPPPHFGMVPPSHHHPYPANMNSYKGPSPQLPPNAYPPPPPPQSFNGKYPPPPPPHPHMNHHPHLHGYMGGAGPHPYGVGGYGGYPHPSYGAPSMMPSSMPQPPPASMPQHSSNALNKLPSYKDSIASDNRKNRKKSISSIASDMSSIEKPRTPKWSISEDEALRVEVEKHGNNMSNINWDVVAASMPGGNSRTGEQCSSRWNKLTAEASAVKGPWTEEEDSKVMDLVAQLGAKQWSKIATHLPGRIGKQCRERWHNHLNPDICKEAWTLSEDRTILKLHVTVGNRWAEMAKLLPGR